MLAFACLITQVNGHYKDYIYKNNFPSYNSFGQTGLIQTPTAEIKKAGSMFFVFNRNEIYKFGSLVVSPFNWMEASYFYYRPSDLYWDYVSSYTLGKYLDKGFSTKFKLINQHKYLPTLSIGLTDFAGTGLFAGEYLVGTYKYDNGVKLSLGLGWGRYSDDNPINNPLQNIDDSFKNRSRKSVNENLGGSPAYDLWFKGPAGIFGGLEYNIPNSGGVKIKLEVDPFDYFKFGRGGPAFSPESFVIREKKSDYNIGVSIPLNKNFIFDISFIKGLNFNFNFNFGANFSKPLVNKNTIRPSKKVFNLNKDKKDNFYLNLLQNLNDNEMFLQTADYDPKKAKLDLVIATSKYRNPLHSAGKALEIIDFLNSELDINLISTTISHQNAGFNLNKIEVKNDLLNRKDDLLYQRIIQTKSVKLSEGGESFNDTAEFKPRIPYPIIFNGLTPALVSHVGAPDQFLFYGIVLRADSEIQFNRKFQLDLSFVFDVTNNLNEAPYNPDSQLPHVRTDIVKYLQESKNYISTFQFDYFSSLSNNIYSKLSFGILEQMYGGAGFEVIYKPFKSNYALGVDLFKVKKRDFDRRLTFRDYEILTGHLTGYYFIDQFNVLAKVSYGKYLAGDTGYTFDISKIFKSGFKTGFFFTRTDVPFSTFGEGSFDKGFYFQVPIDLFLRSYRSGNTNFGLRPLTRDGGQKLEHQNELAGLIFGATQYEVERNWELFFE